ncbi:MAG: Yip1 family protein, partial [Hyphomonadaceae bacterium]
MSANVSSGERPGLIARARDILIRPQSEWRRIAGEEPSPLIGPYIVPLAILGGVAGFGASLLYNGVALNAALAWRGALAALHVPFAVLGVIGVATIVRFFAKRFGAEAEPGRAQQLAAYSATPILIAAVGALAGPAAPIFTAAGVAYALILLGIGAGQVLALTDAENNAPRFTLAVMITSAIGAALASMLIAPLMNNAHEALTGAVEAAAPPPAAAHIAERSAAELAIERLTQGYGARVLADPTRL